MEFRRGVRNYVSRDTVLANRVNNWTASVTPPDDKRPSGFRRCRMNSLEPNLQAVR